MPSELRVDKVSSTASPYTPVFSTTGGALSHRNMIINGAMQVAQRGTSATTNGFGTVDRFSINYSGLDAAPTQAQHALTSSDTGPYEEGFRSSFHITNANQTSGAGTADRIIIPHLIEAQDIANFGWNYTSTSSYITLSFWCKSSVAQNFYGRLQTSDGTAQNYAFETGSLSANTWTKITKTIPGNSNLQFDDNNAVGLTIEFNLFRGTDTTGSVTLNAWGAYNSSARVPDMTSTWYTTNNATWEITGVQLEKGQVATPFEHRSYGDELERCFRYYQRNVGVTKVFPLVNLSTTSLSSWISFYKKMRTQPSDVGIVGSAINTSGGSVSTDRWAIYHNGSWRGCSSISVVASDSSDFGMRLDCGVNDSVTGGGCSGLYGGSSCGWYSEAEL